MSRQNDHGGGTLDTPRRRFLALLGSGAVTGLAGCSTGESTDGDAGGSTADGGTAEQTDAGTQTDGGQTDDVSTAATTQTEGGRCTPGHTDGESACQQVADDVTALTAFDVAGTAIPISFDSPCGWQASTVSQSEEYAQANVTRSEFGSEGNAYVDVQVRAYYAAVEASFLDEQRADGNYEDIEYEYDGETRTGLLSSASSADYGTLASVVVPVDDRLAHVEFISTFDVGSCDVSPRPDYAVVDAMVRSVGANAETTFSFTS